MSPSPEPIHYSNWELFWYLGGFFLWGLAYVVVLYNIWKHKFVEIPAIAVCGNLTWELLWGFVWKVDMLGGTLQWFYRGGALMDIVILMGLFMYGHKQVTLPNVRKVFAPAVVFGLCAWTTLWWFFVEQGYDLPLGSNTAYVIQVVMSLTYITLILRLPEVKAFSWAVTWFRSVGTLMVTVFCFMKYPDNHFVQCMGVLTAVLDATFMVTLWHRKRGLWGPPESVALPGAAQAQGKVELGALATAVVVDEGLDHRQG